MQSNGALEAPADLVVLVFPVLCWSPTVLDALAEEELLLSGHEILRPKHKDWMTLFWALFGLLVKKLMCVSFKVKLWHLASARCTLCCNPKEQLQLLATH